MAIGEALLADIRGLQRRPSEWFSIQEIEKRDPELKVAARYIRKGTDEEFVVPRDERQIHERLEDWAARLFEREVRLYEERLWGFCSENSVVPSTHDDRTLKDEFIQYVDASVKELQAAIGQYTQNAGSGLSPSNLERAAVRLKAELSITLPLAAEITRLEILDSGSDSIDRIGYAEIKIQRFLSRNYAQIPHPFNENDSTTPSAAALQRAIRLMTYVVFKRVEESRLKGFEDKFVSVFLRYLTASRESSGGVADQVSSLLEPFLKKLSFLFAIKNEEGKLIWHSALDGLIGGLNLSASDLKAPDKDYWQGRPTKDAVLRLAYQLRHKSAHEAHDHPYYEHERHAYFVFAAMVLACAVILDANVDISKAVNRQEAADALRDLFVKIEDLTLRSDRARPSEPRSGPATRLEKLVELARRAQAVWPNCSTNLFDLLESEYNTVREELTEADREADIEAYIESMRPDDY